MGLIDKLKKMGTAGVIAATSFMPFSYVKGAQEFIRGDVDGDGRITITDPVKTLNYLFKGSEKLECEDAADLDDDGKIDLGDAVYGLEYLFQGKQEPVKPFPERGYDSTRDGLGCNGEGDLEARILTQADFNNGKFTIRESGTEEYPIIYKLGEDINAPGVAAIDIRKADNIKIDAQGHSITFGGNVKNANGIFVLDARNIKIENLRLYESFTNEDFSSSKTGITFYNVRDSLVSDVLVSTRSALSPGIYFNASENNELSRIKIDTSGYNSQGFSLHKSNSNRFSDIELFIRSNLGRGLNFRESSQNEIYSATMNINGEDSSGFLVYGISRGNKIYDSVIQVRQPNSKEAIFGVDAVGDTELINVAFLNNRFQFISAVNGFKSAARLNIHWYIDVHAGDSSGNHIGNADVKAYNGNRDLVFSALTEPNGRIPRQSLLFYRHTVDGVEHEPYEIEASHPRYVSKVQTIDEIENNIGLDFTLQRK